MWFDQDTLRRLQNSIWKELLSSSWVYSLFVVVVKDPLPPTQHSSSTCAHCMPGEAIPRKMEEGSQEPFWN